MSLVLENVASFFASLAKPAENLVIAVSGGADSVALSWAIIELKETVAWRSLVLAHLNHCLRGAESDADEDFVRQLVDQMRKSDSDVAFESERIDVESERKTQCLGFEAAARQARYRFLAGVAEKYHANYVLTGHTADDQAETVLHRFLRGTGVAGLAGIPRLRTLNGNAYVGRPLLDVTRHDVLQYLSARKQSFCVDSTNAEQEYTRNRLRHHLLPILKKEYNPAIVKVLCRLANQTAELQADQQQICVQLLSILELPRAGSMLVLERKLLAKESPHRIREVLRFLWRREQWPEQNMGFTEWQRAVEVVLGKVRAIDLPGPIRVRAQGKLLQLIPFPERHKK